MPLFLFIYYLKTFSNTFINTCTSHSLRPLQISSSLSLSRGISIGVPGWDANPGLLYRRPTQSLRCAAP
jgi:hypothetical protein